MLPQHIGSRAGFKPWYSHLVWSELCCRNAVPGHGHCFADLTCDAPHHYRLLQSSLGCWLNLITFTKPALLFLFRYLRLCLLAARSLHLPHLLFPFAASIPSLEEQFTFTAPWHGHTRCKVLSKNNPPIY